MSKKWQEALVSNHQAREKLDPTAKLTPISSLIRTIWEARLTLWRRRNEMKHGKTPEEREANQKKILNPRIRTAYRNQFKKMAPTARRQLFQVNLQKRLKFRSKTNRRWLEIVTTAENAQQRRTAYLLSKTPRLPSYYRVTKKRTRISLRLVSKIQPHCVPRPIQSTLRNYVSRWSSPPVSDHADFLRIMAPIREHSVFADKPPAVEAIEKPKEQKKVTDFFGNAAAEFGTESTPAREQKDLPTSSMIRSSNLRASAEQNLCAYEKDSTQEYVVADYVPQEESSSIQSTNVRQQLEPGRSTYRPVKKNFARRNPSIPRRARRR